MKAMPFSFEEFQGKGVLDFCSASDSFTLLLHQPPQSWTRDKEDCYVGTEPTSVLDTTRNPSPSTSSSTMSSSLGSNSTGNGGGGGGGSTNKTTAAAPNASENPPQAALETSTEKCGLRMEDWEGQDQSILRLIMGDVDDPSAGLCKLLQSSGCGSQNVDFNGGFGVVDQGLNMISTFDPSVPGNYPGFPFIAENIDGHNAKTGSVSVAESIFSASANNPQLMSSSPGVFSSQQQQVIGVVDEKPQVINPQLLLNQNQVQFTENPSFFVPLTYPQMQEQQVFSQHQAKPPLSDAVGHNYQVPRLPLLYSGQELFARRQQTQLPLFPHHLQQQQSLVVPSAKQQKVSSDDASHQQLQQALIDQLFKAAELIETGNPELAQGILARLNHQLSPIGKPFQRAAFYLKEALQSLLHSNGNNCLTFSPSGLLLKIGAYKSFSEVSPVLQFANFTCNQALLEAVDGFDRVHIIDFDIGFGGQWASFMQELALRNGGAPALKITAFVSPNNHEEIELSFTQENLKQYASEINISFELEFLNLDSLNSASWPQPLRDCEAIAVNLPIASFLNCPSNLHLVLRFVKQLMPKIVVTLDRSCDRTDATFAQLLIYALQSYAGLLESLDSVNVNPDVLQVIEKYFLHPAMEKLVLGRARLQERTSPWKNLFLTSGFSPGAFSNFTESQADCLVQRTPGRGFHVEKRQSFLALCWHRKDLISVSTWRC